MSEFSGPQWCAHFPTSNAVEALAEPFRSKVKSFQAALLDAGATIHISATLRPKERGYLMHGAWVIARLHVDPKTIPAMEGVDIDWTHGGDVIDARDAAAAMVATYGIAYEPSLTSRHYEGRAIDWTIGWQGVLKIRSAAGTQLVIATDPRSGANTELWAIGADYGVHKLASDAPHWSDDGH